VRVQLTSPAPLNLQLEYEGYLEPRSTNGGPNGLLPGTWEFEGTEKGEPSLRLSEAPSGESSTTGILKLIGLQGQELISVK